MSQVKRITRRRICVYLASGAALAGSSAVIYHLGGSKKRSDASERQAIVIEWLNGLDDDSIRELGGRYLTEYPEESNRDVLLETIFGDYDGKSDVNDYISDRIEADWQNRENFVVDGWILSLTEARLYAALATS